MGPLTLLKGKQEMFNLFMSCSSWASTEHIQWRPYFENIAEVAVRCLPVMEVKGWSAHNAACQTLLKRKKEMA